MCIHVCIIAVHYIISYSFRGQARPAVTPFARTLWGPTLEA